MWVGGYRVKREGNGFRILSSESLVWVTGSMSISTRFGIFSFMFHSTSIFVAFVLLNV